MKLKMVRSVANVRIYETDLLTITVTFRDDGVISVIGIKRNDSTHWMTISPDERISFIMDDVDVSAEYPGDVVIVYEDEELHISTDKNNKDMLMGYGSILLYCGSSSYTRLPNGMKLLIELNYK